jgi:hypothetical protein
MWDSESVDAYRREINAIDQSVTAALDCRFLIFARKESKRTHSVPYFSANSTRRPRNRMESICSLGGTTCLENSEVAFILSIGFGDRFSMNVDPADI